MRNKEMELEIKAQWDKENKMVRDYLIGKFLCGIIVWLGVWVAVIVYCFALYYYAWRL